MGTTHAKLSARSMANVNIDPSLLFMQPSGSGSNGQRNGGASSTLADFDVNELLGGLGAGDAAALDADGKPKSRKEREQDAKDVELAKLLDLMDQWKPIIPDEVTDFYLQKAGFETSDPRIKRLLALATQRFVSSVAADAFQYARTRTTTNTAGRPPANAQGSGAGSSQAGARKDRQKTVLTMEDLSAALQEYGINCTRAPYYL